MFCQGKSFFPGKVAFSTCCVVLSAQKVLSGSDRGGRLRLMGKSIDHRLVARPEPDNTFRTDSTFRIRVNAGRRN